MVVLLAPARRARSNRARGVSPEAISVAAAYVEKYLEILGATHLPRPRIEVRSNIAAKWLGADQWNPMQPSNTVLFLQRSILGDPMTLERVIAHETIHHVDFLSIPPERVEMFKLGRRFRSDAHGDSFKAAAARINAVMGDKFVTESSDERYVVAKNEKPFFLLIVPVYYKKEWALGWMWAARLSEDGAAKVEQKIANEGARLVRSTDGRWLRGAKIKRFGGVTLPTDPSEFEMLRAIYVEAR